MCNEEEKTEFPEVEMSAEIVKIYKNEPQSSSIRGKWTHILLLSALKLSKNITQD